jgi:hypothetical protein
MTKMPSRSEIDSWTIENSGLPKRVVNAASEQNIKTVGELRQITENELLQWRGVGEGTLADIRSFLSTCRKLEKGRTQFKDLRGLINKFFSKNEIDVLTDRYGLNRKDCSVSRNYYTLQYIANKKDLTRERVRQIQGDSLKNLSSHIVAASLIPFHQQIIDLINSTGKIMSCSTLHEAKLDIFKSFSPCATTLLLSDSESSGFIFRHGVFTTLTKSGIDTLHTKIKKKLDTMNKPVKLSDLAKGMEPNAVMVMLSSIPNVLITRNGRVIHSLKSIEAFIFEFIPKNAERFHYKDLADIANEYIIKSTRKNPGFYLHKLSKIDAFKREGLGVYRVRNPR